jgi:hypothetical protein
VPAERIAENLAFINWTVLTALAVGSFVAVVVGRMRTAATRGYLAFTAICAVAFGLLAVASDGALPATSSGSPVLIDPAWEGPRHVALWALCGLAAIYAGAIVAGRTARLVAYLGVLAGGAVLVFAGLSWGGGPLGATLLIVQLGALAASTGGVWAAMILGHWYLVTPHLGEAPLVLYARALGLVVALQVLLFAIWTASGAGPAGAAGFAALGGSWALFVWLRLIVGLLFPLVVSWAALQTARTRSMESATGLLYIDVGTIAAGTILAAGLYFGAGLLV